VGERNKEKERKTEGREEESAGRRRSKNSFLNSELSFLILI
jgi:hypothetical protein